MSAQNVPQLLLMVIVGDDSSMLLKIAEQGDMTVKTLLRAVAGTADRIGDAQ